MRRVRQKALKQEAIQELGRVPRKPVLRYLRRIYYRPGTLPSVHARQGHGTTQTRTVMMTNRMATEAGQVARRMYHMERDEKETARWAGLRKQLRGKESARKKARFERLRANQLKAKS